MKYHVRMAMSLLLISQVPASAANVQTALSAEYSQIPATYAAQWGGNSFFITLVFLQICLFELLCQLTFKFVRRGAKQNCLARPVRSSRDCSPRDGTTLYEQFISKRSCQNFPGPNSYYQAPDQHIKSLEIPPADLVIDREADDLVSQKTFKSDTNELDLEHLRAEPLLEFHLNELSTDSHESERLSFNSAYFACDQICDALFSKDIANTVHLLKSYGRIPAVMSLVERKLMRAAIDCHWRLDARTGEGELLLKNKLVVLCFRSYSNCIVEAIVNKTVCGKTNQTKLAFQSSQMDASIDPLYSNAMIPNAVTLNYQLA